MVKPAKKKGILHDFYAPLADLGLREAADETKQVFAPAVPFEDPQQGNIESPSTYQTTVHAHKEIRGQGDTQPGIEGDTLAGLQGDTLLGRQDHTLSPTVADMVTPSQERRVTGIQGDRVTPSQDNTNSISRVLYPAQAAVLSALVALQREGTQIYTREAIASRARSTKSGVDKAFTALERKRLIAKRTAYREGTRGQEGYHITISQDAPIALLLSGYNDQQGIQGVTPPGVQDDRATGIQGVTPICSSSILKTTTTAETISDEIADKFSQLILDDWGQWGLRPAAIQSFMAKPLALLQDLLDRTAYAIRQKEGTNRPIQNKIGFLKTNLQNEFCDVDDSFITREERIRKQRTEQLKRETERIKAAREEERDAAIELLSLQLSEGDFSAIKQQAIKLIKDELGPHMYPSTGVIAARERSILAGLAKERGMLS